MPLPPLEALRCPPRTHPARPRRVSPLLVVSGLQVVVPLLMQVLTAALSVAVPVSGPVAAAQSVLLLVRLAAPVAVPGRLV